MSVSHPAPQPLDGAEPLRCPAHELRDKRGVSRGLLAELFGLQVRAGQECLDLVAERDADERFVDELEHPVAGIESQRPSRHETRDEAGVAERKQAKFPGAMFVRATYALMAPRMELPSVVMKACSG
ncbi:MAG: hypothetical protein OXI87_08935 [Albidovulum sp.]|nr:hypothetical protein [Albidovulum sp.]MDE0530073.1 hypothetical protein [Albidovulum sp.]